MYRSDVEIVCHIYRIGDSQPLPHKYFFHAESEELLKPRTLKRVSLHEIQVRELSINNIFILAIIILLFS